MHFSSPHETTRIAVLFVLIEGDRGCNSCGLLGQRKLQTILQHTDSKALKKSMQFSPIHDRTILNQQSL